MFEFENITYLDVEYLEELNKDAIILFVQKKGDSFELLSYRKLYVVVDACKYIEGDIYDKAVVLLKGIVKAHAFASGNRRTAVLAVFSFCRLNGHNVYTYKKYFL